MNIKIAKTMLALCIVYIIGFYVLKFIFPEYLLLTITDPNVLTFGKFIESNIVAHHIYCGITTFTTYYLFVSASKASFKINLKDLICIFVGVIISSFVTHYLPEYIVHTSTSIMFILALLCNGKLKYAVPSFVLHGYLSQFLFSIRGFETIIFNINTASGTILMIEGWVWLILLGLIFYLKEKRNGKISTTILT